MWTRYFNAETETEKEETNINSASVSVSINNKPPGLYMARDDEWIEWCRRQANGFDDRYTHKKVLLNLDAFHILRLDMNNFSRYLKPVPFMTHFKEVDWQTVFDEGYDGVHITEPLITNAMSIWAKYKVQFGSYDVETLVIWASPAKQKMKWSTHQ